MFSQKIITLDEFIIQREKESNIATGELSGLLRDIGLAAKIISREVNKAGLTSILGEANNTNVQGEDQKKLDVIANELFKLTLRNSGECAGIASEEEDSFVAFDSAESKASNYVVLFDPLDGSSNIDVNVSIGTIFAIYRRKTKPNEALDLRDFLQAGKHLVASGYVLYGSSTMLVYTTGNGVNGFTLDQSIGEFCLSHPNIQTPENGKMYSLNQGNINEFPNGVQQYVTYCSETCKETKRPYSLRYIGSMVSDFHRNLLKGGIYIYPSTEKDKNGKLRLLYECAPLAFLAEQAGGKATTGFQRIMDVEPSELHQRVPIFIGSKNMVQKAESYLS